MNLTSQQKNLLLAIVDGHLSGDGAPFIFVQSPTDCALCYPQGRCFQVNADEIDIRQLAVERLIIIVRAHGSGLSGKPTQLGIETVASLRSKPASLTSSNDAAGDELRAKPSKELKLDSPLSRNPFPEDDPKHDTLTPFFEVMAKFQVLAEEYPALSMDWIAEDGKWISWPPPARAVGEGETCPTSPGGDVHIVTSAGEACRQLLGAPESWFNLGRDPWLDVMDKEAWEHWLYAIREFWLNAADEAEAAAADMDEFYTIRLDASDEAEDTGADAKEFANFGKAAEEVGYRPTHSPSAVGERVWRKMVKSKKSLRNALQELGLSPNGVGAYEEPAGWVQRGCIKYIFRACAYFCGVLAARRARELENVEAPKLTGGESPTAANEPTPGKRLILRLHPTVSPKTLSAALDEAEKLAANERQRTQFRVVTLYDWYLRELKTLKAALGQKPGKLSERKTLRERYPWSEVWEAMNREDIDQIEKIKKKDFIPNRWALSLAVAHEGLTSLSGRSIINYRKALKNARQAP